MTLAVAWALNRPTSSDDYLVIENLVVRISAKPEEAPLCAVIGFVTSENAHARAIHLTEVAERLGSVMTHAPRMLNIPSMEYLALCARATGGLDDGTRWKPDLEAQQIVLRVLTQGTKI